MNHAQRLVLLIEALEGRAQTPQDLARVLGVGASLVGEDSRDFVFVLPYGGGLLSLHPPTQTREAAALEGQRVPLHVSASPRGVDRPRSALLHRLKTRPRSVGAEYTWAAWGWTATLCAQDSILPLTPHAAALLLLGALAALDATAPQDQEPSARTHANTGGAAPLLEQAPPSLSPLGPMRRALGPLQVGLDLKPKAPAQGLGGEGLSNHKEALFSGHRQPPRAPQDDITAQGMAWLDSMSRAPSDDSDALWWPPDEMRHPEEQWRGLLRRCLTDPTADHRQDRTGVGTCGICGAMMRFDLREGFPAFTSKRLAWGAVVEELAWFLRGSTNVGELQAKGVSIWDDNARAALARKPYLQGALDTPTRSDLALALGPIYGQQWRSWGATYKDGNYYCQDQIAALVHGLLTAPDSRRHVVSAWNVQDLPHMALAPCHVLFQAYSHPSPTPDAPRGLSLTVYQRSCDLFLGVPFNVASYALLLHLLARWTGHEVRELVWFGGDVHLYDNHHEQAREVLAREPRPLPTLGLASCVGPLDASEVGSMRERRVTQEPSNLFWVVPAMAQLVDYNPHPTIKAPMAV